MKLQLVFVLLAVSFLSCHKSAEDIQTETPGPIIDSAAGSLAHPDHIIFVWFKNKNYNTIMDSTSAPYINSLAARGTLFTNMFAVTHPSYPNYVDFFAGDPMVLPIMNVLTQLLL